MTLAEFLLARIAEDERYADDPCDGHDPGEPGEASRVLAECEAKRRIIEMALVGPVGWTTYNADWDSALDGVLRALGLPYADHPDYDEAWRP